MFEIGVPGNLYYHMYKPFIDTFTDVAGIHCRYSLKSSREILDRGNKVCIDEACLPIKLFAGHCSKLSEKCDFIAVPRIMMTECSESICPKFCGLPELTSEVGAKDWHNIFSEPLYVNDMDSLRGQLWDASEVTGIGKATFDKAFEYGVHAQRHTVRGIDDIGYRNKVFLAGHSYNIYDSYANLNLIEKLHRLDIGVITEERVSRYDKEKHLAKLIKKPYWHHLTNIYGAAMCLAEKRSIDGIIYVSSFSCGTDSITAQLIKNRLPSMPFLMLKIDEQTGAAGFDTRLEAFQFILERRFL